VTVLVIILFQDRHHSRSDFILTLMGGFTAFVAALIVQMALFFVEANIIVVVTEEAAKATIIRLIGHRANAVGVCASFAASELLFGKLVFHLAFFEAEVSQAGPEFMALAYSTAYVMHLTTGLLYRALPLGFSFTISLLLHLIYNGVVGQFVESATELLPVALATAITFVVTLALTSLRLSAASGKPGLEE
jgi:hypothetical protein